MPLRTRTFAAIDFESAGAGRGDTDTPVQIGIAVMEGWELRVERNFVSFLRSDRPVTWRASQIHGIRTEDLASAPRLADLWLEINSRLRGAVVVAHGAGTEKRFLRALPLHGFGPWLDTLKLARNLWPGVPDYSLETLVHSANLREELDHAVPGRRFHDALYDAAASLLVLRHLVTHAGLAESPLAALPG